MLTDYLGDFLQNGGSLLIAAHDADEYLPLTNRRLLLTNGSMREETLTRAEAPV